MSFHARLPRLYELQALVPDRTSPGAYFQDFEKRLAESEHVLKTYLRIERWLDALDGAAWKDLRDRAAVHLLSNGGGRGWQSLFDVLGEARAYCHLKEIGCSAISFVPRGSGKTPDLKASLGGSSLYCEVKMINISDVEVEHRLRVQRERFAVRRDSVHLDPGLLSKVAETIRKAVQQLDAVDPDRRARRMVFIVVHFDDWLGRRLPEYFAQLDEFLLQQPAAEAELVFCPGSNLFDRTFSMQSATVLNG